MLQKLKPARSRRFLIPPPLLGCERGTFCRHSLGSCRGGPLTLAHFEPAAQSFREPIAYLIGVDVSRPLRAKAGVGRDAMAFPAQARNEHLRVRLVPAFNLNASVLYDPPGIRRLAAWPSRIPPHTMLPNPVQFPSRFIRFSQAAGRLIGKVCA